MRSGRDEVARILDDAGDLAAGAGQVCSTVHILLALFVQPSVARELLIEAGVDHRNLIATFRSMRERSEDPSATAEVLRHAEALAARSDADGVDSTSVLASLLRVRHSAAGALLREAGLDAAALRARVIGAMTRDRTRERGNTRPRLAVPGADADTSAGGRTRPTGPRPSGLRDRLGESVTTGEFEAWTAATRRDDDEPPAPRALPLPTTLLEPFRSPRRRRPPTWPPVDVVPARSRQRGHGGASAVLVADADSGAFEGVDTMTAPPPPLLPDGPAAYVDDGHRDLTDAQASAGARCGDTVAPVVDETGAFALDPARFPLLHRIGRDLTAAARDGETTPLIGREALVEAIIDVLLMRQVNNPCLVGEAGVGKTALVEGLACRLAAERGRYGRLGDAIIVEVQVSALLAGTALRGSFAERMSALRDEVASANGRIIVFIDEIHTLMGAGAGDGPHDAANDLKTAMSRGRFPLIGATTTAEYRRFIEADPAMERRFQVIDVPEPTPAEAVHILSGLAPIYAAHHGIPYSHGAIVSAVELSRRFLPDRALPDKAIAVLDRAGAQAQRRGSAQVSREDVARSVAVLGGVAMERLLDDERARLRDLGADLRGVIIGQDEATSRLARRVLRNHAGVGGDRPLASFVVAGPPGVGKTALGAALAGALFLTEDALVRLDMGDYADPHTVSRLIGSPPGYVGHAQPGLLSDALHRKPYRVVLLDDIDRAAPEVLALVQQLLDSGRLVDNQGRTLDFRNSVVVMTTTLSPELYGLGRGPVGFLAPPRAVGPDPERLALAVRKRVGAELVARADDVLLFAPLAATSLRTIAALELARFAAKVERDRLIRVHFDSSVAAAVAAVSGSDEQGARPLRGRMAAMVEDPVSEAMVDGLLRAGMAAVASMVDGALVFRDDDDARARATAGDEGVGDDGAGDDAQRADQPTAPTQIAPREMP